MIKNSNSWFSLEKLLWILWVVITLLSMFVNFNSLHNILSALNGMLEIAAAGCVITGFVNFFRHKRDLFDRYYWIFISLLLLTIFMDFVLHHV